jgi:hypothetical protein
VFQPAAPEHRHPPDTRHHPSSHTQEIIMARRNPATEATSTEGTESEVTQPEQVEATSTEGTQPEQVEQAEGTQTEAPAKAEPDLTAFTAAVEAAVAERDTSTGEVPASGIEAVNVQYRELDTAGKRAGRDYCDEGVKKGVAALDVQTARAYSMVRDNLQAGSKSSTPKAPADPALAFVQSQAALRLASTLVERPEVPEDRDLDAEVEALVASLADDVTKLKAYEADTSEEKGDAPSVSPVIRRAFKLAAGKSSGGGSGRATSTFDGPRRSTKKHIEEAFAEQEVGAFLTVAQIANFTSEEYGDDHPSQGAISARLWPDGDASKCTVKVIRPVDRDEAKSAFNASARGAVKI